ncbi:hypothetical protein LXL04_034059 [Taraxacum kok-saghyz]
MSKKELVGNVHKKELVKWTDWMDECFIQSIFGFVSNHSKFEAISLKTKKVLHYNEMLALFARDRASGEHAETFKDKNV